MWQVEMQFIPGNNQIWVLRFDPGDPILEFETYQEAVDKAAELQEADTTGRQYRAVEK
jgi:hypothetical protein